MSTAEVVGLITWAVSVIMCASSFLVVFQKRKDSDTSSRLDVIEEIVAELHAELEKATDLLEHLLNKRDC